MTTLPPGFDPADLGSRDVAGWIIVFNVENETADHRSGVRYRERYDPHSCDIDLIERGTNRALIWEHAFGAVDAPIRSVPLGRGELAVCDYGVWARATLHRGQMADAVLESARAGELGFSIGAKDLDPCYEEDDEPGLPLVVRRRLRLNEVSLTPDPNFGELTAVRFVGGKPVTERDYSDEYEHAERGVAEFCGDWFGWVAELAAERGEDMGARVNAVLDEEARSREAVRTGIMQEIAENEQKLRDAAVCRRRADELARARRARNSQDGLVEESTLRAWAAKLESEARNYLEPLIEPLACEVIL